MDNRQPLTRGRIAAALVVAILTDLVQLPLNLLFVTGVLGLPSEVAVGVLDTVAFLLATLLLGFHWTLLPTFALELIPLADALPTWTGCVAFVIWRRRRALSVASLVSSAAGDSGAAGVSRAPGVPGAAGMSGEPGHGQDRTSAP